MAEILRHPTEEDWERCRALALATVGRKYAGERVTEDWKHKMLLCGHSPIRTLMFTIRIGVPYWVSVHLVRHKFGVEHYVSSQRNDRQHRYDRTKAPQDTPVSHVLDINAQALIHMANMRLCCKASEETRQAMREICEAVIRTNPEFGPFLKPKCVLNGGCDEFVSCGLSKRKEL